jgi:hypothetical protein
MSGPSRPRRKSNLFALLVIILIPTSLAAPTVFVHTNPQTACDLAGLNCAEGRHVMCTRIGGSSKTSRGMKGGSIHAFCGSGEAENEIETTRLTIAQWVTTGLLFLISVIILALVLRWDVRRRE